MNVFGALVRNPLTTVIGFVAEATNTLRASLATASHYHESVGIGVLGTFSPELGVGVSNIRGVIPDVVQEELKI